MIVIANVFPKLQTVQILVRPLYEKRCFRTPFDSQDVKAPKMLGNLHERSFTMFFIILIEVELENVSPTIRWNLRGVC